YDAYHEAFPLARGWQRRVKVYVLYHLLNHLNLFGGGYHNQCCETAAEILSG
ncbi:MAG: fructosamine kinase family protein, partial [Planctomycetes bacterium]|nr:fructosamine kinase family protein [Planctomycetota bacterium]